MLTILSGPGAGHRTPLVAGFVTLGRHPSCDIRFDPADELDVSAWHAAVLRGEAGHLVRDLGSTNGTWVNGRRVRGDQPLAAGDRIRLGARGPELGFTVGDVERAARERPSTDVRIRAEVARQLDPLRRRLAALAAVAVLAVLAAVGAIAWRAADGRRTLAMERNRTAQVADSLQALLTTVAEVAGPAIAMVFVDRADGSAVTATGFVADARGDTAWIVTSGHALLDGGRRPPRRVAVVFNGRRVSHPAQFVAAHDRADLGAVRVVVARPPQMRGAARAPAVVGEAVVTIGFPMGLDLPMGGDWRQVGLTASVLRATVSRVAPGLLQLDGYGASGASGSPVLNAAGDVVGVLYGEERASGGRILYAVPAEAVGELLGGMES